MIAVKVNSLITVIIIILLFITIRTHLYRTTEYRSTVPQQKSVTRIGKFSDWMLSLARFELIKN